MGVSFDTFGLWWNILSQFLSNFSLFTGRGLSPLLISRSTLHILLPINFADLRIALGLKVDRYDAETVYHLDLAYWRL
jgi:hypothetical protein